MSNFNDGAPRNPKQWINLGRNLVPLYEGVPIVKDWQNKKFQNLTDNFSFSLVRRFLLTHPHATKKF